MIGLGRSRKLKLTSKYRLIYDFTKAGYMFYTKTRKSSSLASYRAPIIEFRDAICPTFSGFPGFRSLQYENEIHFALF